MSLCSALDLLSLRGQNILGINPPVYDFAWFDLWAKPVGLLGFLQSLRKNGNRVYLLDCLHEGRTGSMSFGRSRVSRELCEKPQAYRQIPRRYYRFGMGAQDFRAGMLSFPRPDVILVTSVMTYWYPGVWEAVWIAKELFPDVPVVLGGIYAILCPEDAGRSGADFVLTAPCPPDTTHIPMDL